MEEIHVYYTTGTFNKKIMQLTYQGYLAEKLKLNLLSVENISMLDSKGFVFLALKQVNENHDFSLLRSVCFLNNINTRGNIP